MEKMTGIDELFPRLGRRLFVFYKTYIERDQFYVALARWHRVNGDATLRLDYPLSETSIVLDVGGYEGNWCAQIATRFNPNIFVLEPVPSHYKALAERFASNPRVKVYNFGLSGKSETQTLSVLADGSSVFRAGANQIRVELVDICAFIERTQIDEIDLIKINIEGGEYPLLARMLETGVVKKCKDIQIQFHDFVPDAELLRQRITQQLEKTHDRTYDYFFIWENWRRR
ncbi:MAG: FkbM family methyltransferase [Nitrospirae bacterium]|nr:FkbM family methyltransferase [Nitrospirota bacterium]